MAERNRFLGRQPIRCTFNECKEKSNSDSCNGNGQKEPPSDPPTQEPNRKRKRNEIGSWVGNQYVAHFTKMLVEDEKVEVFVTHMEQDGTSVLLWAQTDKDYACFLMCRLIPRKVVSTQDLMLWQM